jgi:hypothetical protein
MLTHVHKVIHLVVAIFDKGGEVGEVEEQFRVDRMLALQRLDLDSAFSHHAQGRARPQFLTGR